MTPDDVRLYFDWTAATVDGERVLTASGHDQDAEATIYRDAGQWKLGVVWMDGTTKQVTLTANDERSAASAGDVALFEAERGRRIQSLAIPRRQEDTKTMSPTPEQDATLARVRAARDTIDDLSHDLDEDMLAELDRAEAEARAQGVTVEPWDHGIEAEQDRERDVERERDERTR